LVVSNETIVTYSVYHIHNGCGVNDGYIGITKNTELRFQQHKWSRKQTNKHLKAALLKYANVIEFSVLAKHLTYHEAKLLEKKLRPFPNIGWNIAAGGDVPPNPKGKERSLEHRKNISKSKQGSKNPMFGKKLNFSEEHRQNLSKSSTGRKSKFKNIKREQIECPHCGLIGGVGAMHLWHFDACRKK
jgi:group I intron endonuclease